MGYQFKSRVRYSEVDETCRLTLVGLVNYFQDCNTFHSEHVGNSLGETITHHRAWILASWQIGIKRLPMLGEDVTVETWVYKFKGFYGERNYRMLDASGATLAQAASMWIYMDTERHRPSKIEEEVRNMYGVEEALPMGTFSRKVAMEEPSVQHDSFAVMRSHLDSNHHVNNGQYILMAEEYLPQDFAVRQVRVEYRKSAVLHDMIVPFVHTEPGKCLVDLRGEDGQTYAVLEFCDTEAQAGE